ncbi:hypothetical protein B4923_15075 [Brenneria roseae subsp. americana]|uniref:Uncharacterized protein n=2 Tax=Brenneria roseae TaxID=1509241 RepID=A0A2U1TN57_9GAMM|nr:hypothetical protein B4923_15075 [Brenneria roseae subsp. americana]
MLALLLSDHTEPDENIIILAMETGGKSAGNFYIITERLVSVSLIQADIAFPLNKNMSGIYSVIILG